MAEIMYWAGSYDNAYKISDRNAFWQITTLGGGVTYAWQPGMWTKGPISPGCVTPNARGNRREPAQRVSVRLTELLCRTYAYLSVPTTNCACCA